MLNSSSTSNTSLTASNGWAEIDRLLRDLYASRLSGDPEAVSRLFSADAKLQIAGASQASPIKAPGADDFRPLLARLIKTFKLSDLTILATVIEGNQATVHWRVNLRSRISGATAATDLNDPVEVCNGRIVNFNEAFVSR
jgi:ketosteroid isomerase-like protein